MTDTHVLAGRIRFRGRLRAETGLHIGAPRETLAIGAVDLPVVRDPITREPYVPGSSFKGRLRSLVEARDAKPANRTIRQGMVSVHVCDTRQQAAACTVCRLFGSSAGSGSSGSNFPARLLVRDAFMPRYMVDRLRQADTDLLYTEVKSENALDRVTAAAVPRQIERVPAGTDFAFELIYAVEDAGSALQEDLETLVFGLVALEDAALGGHGSRGYGKVQLRLAEVAAYRAEAYLDEAPAGVYRWPTARPGSFTRATPEEPPDVDLKPVGEFARAVRDLVDHFRRAGTAG